MKEILFIIIYMAQLYCTGKYVVQKYSIHDSKWYYFSVGFVVQISIIELLGWWMVAFRQPFRIFFILCILVMMSGILLAFREIHVGVGLWKLEKKNRDTIFTLVIMLVLIGIICSQLFLFYRSDADDSFYVSNVLLFAKSDRINMYDSSFGNKTLGTVPMYDFQIWESYLAVLCKVSSIKPTIMCHYVMVFVIFFVAISAMLFMGTYILEGDTERNIFVIVLLLFYLMGGYAVYSKGSFLLSRLWQGKAVYLHVVLPVTIAYILAYIDKQRESKIFGIGLMMIMIAGIALNPTSMYVVGFQILFMILAIAIYKKDIKVCLYIIPTLIVILFVSLMILLRTNQFDGQIEAASEIPKGFAIQVFQSFMGNGMAYFIVYLICCVIIMAMGDVKGKIVCIGTPILLLIGVWNPIMASIVAKHLTMTPSYWRVFWLLPIDYAIAYCTVLLFRKKNVYVVGMILLILAVICSGRYMFTSDNYFVRAQNKERIPQAILDLGELVDSNENTQIVLACDSAATTLRQEYNSIELIFSRYQYVLDLFRYRGKEIEANDRIHMFEFVNNSDGLENYENIEQLLKQYDVAWILIDRSQQEKISYLEQIGYSVVANADNLILLNN